ncbi:hypothetical protein WJX72_011516 [[Myrmecia] bisecta]|uniref:Uncharacterized protein n=1 Tax=[Myrmecia] bisecta TaxID=41462 RepID=A0AAW1QTV2_9CHLO
MALSSSLLQEQVDALQQQAPRLAPLILPRGFADADLTAFLSLEAEQEAGQSAFDKALRHGAEGVQRCGVCGREGLSVTSTSGAAEKEALLEADLLRFTTFWRTDFKSRTLRLHRGLFACGLCRALRDPGRLLWSQGTCVAGL